MKSDHGILHRYNLLLQACITEIFPSKEDWDVLRQAGLGVCLLDGLPDWTIKYAAGVVCVYWWLIDFVARYFWICSIMLTAISDEVFK
jgi:hypothetical protein